jgi:glycosyltransferase involved in cell wall biosynthesis
MKVIENFKDNYNEDPIRFWNFNEFADTANDILLFVGSSPDLDILKEPSTRPKYFFSSEEQAWAIDGTDQYLPYCNTIFTICPPHFTGRQNRRSAFFPFNPKYIPNNADKKYDVIYTGLASGPHIEHALNIIKNYNYRFVSFGNGSNVTNSNATYIEKLQLIANTKVSIIHNQTQSGPQLKSRPFEAGFCRTLMLVLRDEYNIIEEWFTPDVDFIYYDNDNLKDTLDKILANFSDYQHIIDNAYRRCIQEYTTRSFIAKYIGFKNE